MPFFSAPQPLDTVMEDALSAAYREDVVGKREYRTGLGKLAHEQPALVAALQPGEKLQVVVPCFQGNYQGLAVLTQRRVLYFKGKIRNQMTLGHIADTTLLAHPGGFILVEIKGLNYRPYSSQLPKAALDEYQRNYIQFSMSGAEVAQHFVALVDGIRANPDAAAL